ncbi:MAG: hypothetical protein HOY79_06295 [Streptomyces sp.]|nr:hypothetical protein [Streptomyces sp.]
METPTLTVDTIRGHVCELAERCTRLATDLSGVDAEARRRVGSARVATTLWAQVRDAMNQREPWLRERSQVLALLESAEYAALNAGWEPDRPADMAETVVAWMATQPTQLRVGAQMGMDSDEGMCRCRKPGGR